MNTLDDVFVEEFEDPVVSDPGLGLRLGAGAGTGDVVLAILGIPVLLADLLAVALGVEDLLGVHGVAPGLDGSGDVAIEDIDPGCFGWTPAHLGDDDVGRARKGDGAFVTVVDK